MGREGEADGTVARPGRLFGRVRPAEPDRLCYRKCFRGLAEAAATNPHCEWRVIVTDAEGHAIGVTRPSLRGAGAGVFDEPAPGWVTRIVLTVPVWALADRALRDHCQSATSGRLGGILAAALAAADREAAASARTCSGMPTSMPVPPSETAGTRGRSAVTGFRNGCGSSLKRATRHADSRLAVSPLGAPIWTTRSPTTSAGRRARATSTVSAAVITG